MLQSRWLSLGFLFFCKLCMLSVVVGVLQSAASEMDPEIRYAENFTIEKREGYQLITVKHAYQGAGDAEYRYVLYPRGSEKPEVGAADAFVQVPVTRSIVLSTTFLAAMDVVGATDSIVGVGAFDYVNTASVLQRIHDGKIVEVGSETMKNIELMVSLDPEVIFTNIVGSPDYDVHPTLHKMGITSAITAAYMEKTILGRAEWVKYVGAFYAQEEAANQFFEKIEQQYLALKQQVAAVTDRPTVLANAPWGSVWYVPSGKSFIANLIADAGGLYLWRDLMTDGSQPMDFETVYEKALEADVWINSGYLDTMSAIEAQDERYLDFQAVQEGKVFSESLRVSPQGGNDIWERGFIHPEEILSDLVHIFHPEVLPNHEFVYYKLVK